jgi:Tfp pilus assembly PilM family ATPase
MQWKNAKTAVGLDIGRFSVKAIRLERQGKSYQVKSACAFIQQAEGLLDDDEAELYKFTGSWLKEHKLADLPICLGLPQELTNSQYSSFPPNLTVDNLRFMVKNLTNQFSGLSDEAFLDNFCLMSPVKDQPSQVLIGVCRQSLVEDSCTKATAQGLNVQDQTMNGAALANAFLLLQPLQAASSSLLHLLLDLGTETSTLVFLRQNRVLGIASLMFGTSTFQKIMATNAQPVAPARSDDDVVELQIPYQPNWDNPDDYIHLAVRRLQEEISGAIQHWLESQDNQELDSPSRTLWISGRAATIPGLASHLASAEWNDVQLLGPEIDGRVAPEYTVALGLAYHGTGASPLQLSLIPTLLQWQQEKVTRFPFLACALALLAAATIAFAIWFHLHLNAEQEKVDDKLAELKKCNSLVPDLDNSLETIGYYQKLLIPIVESGTRSRTFLHACDVLYQARSAAENTDADWWCYYLADEFSYYDSDAVKRLEKEQTPAKTPADATRLPMNPFANPFTEPQEEDPADDYIPVFEIKPLTMLFTAGFLPARNNRGRYEDIKLINEQLNKAGLFTGVDWFNEWAAPKSYDNWSKYLANNQKHFGNFHTFVFKLPLRDHPVTPPQQPPPSGKKRGAKGTDKQAGGKS